MEHLDQRNSGVCILFFIFRLWIKYVWDIMKKIVFLWVNCIQGKEEPVCSNDGKCYLSSKIGLRTLSSFLSCSWSLPVFLMARLPVAVDCVLCLSVIIFLLCICKCVCLNWVSGATVAKAKFVHMSSWYICPGRWWPGECPFSVHSPHPKTLVFCSSRL